MSGVVSALKNGDWQVHMQIHVWGRNMHVQGPRRSSQEKSKAESDLATIRKAAEAVESSGRDDVVYDAMKNAAEHLQREAELEFAASLRAMKNANDAEEKAADTKSCKNISFEVSSDSSDWEMYDMPVGPARDVGESWQNITEHSTSFVERTQKVVTPENEIHATQLLAAVEPAVTTVDDFRMLLNARANPNVRGSEGDSILGRVLTFAMPSRVEVMRELLLDAGAVEDKALEAQWQGCKEAIMCESSWMEQHHRDPEEPHFQRHD